MSFLQRLRSNWNDFFLRRRRLGPVETDEPLTRFLTSKSHYARSKRLVKQGAFLPKDGEPSVFRVAELPDRVVWRIGYLAIEKRYNKTVHGRGDLSAHTINDVGLRVAPDDRPRRHANIVGWPSDKPEQKLLALELSKTAELVLKNGGS